MLRHALSLSLVLTLGIGYSQSLHAADAQYVIEQVETFKTMEEAAVFDQFCDDYEDGCMGVPIAGATAAVGMVARALQLSAIEASGASAGAIGMGAASLYVGVTGAASYLLTRGILHLLDGFDKDISRNLFKLMERIDRLGDDIVYREFIKSFRDTNRAERPSLIVNPMEFRNIVDEITRVSAAIDTRYCQTEWSWSGNHTSHCNYGVRAISKLGALLSAKKIDNYAKLLEAWDDHGFNLKVEQGP